MKSKVYLETTIVSYLVASPTQDIVRAAHQQVTREWWARRERFDLFVSRLVLAEARRGDTTAAARRLDALAGMPLLAMNRAGTTLATTLIRTGTLPTKARLDALHVATAAVNGMDYLSHGTCGISRTPRFGKIEDVCRSAGVQPPIICRPEELMEA